MELSQLFLVHHRSYGSATEQKIRIQSATVAIGQTERGSTDEVTDVKMMRSGSGGRDLSDIIDVVDRLRRNEVKVVVDIDHDHGSIEVDIDILSVFRDRDLDLRMNLVGITNAQIGTPSRVLEDMIE